MMETIKSFTSLEQSKKLAQILPLESADMWWTALNWQETEYYVEVKQDGINQPKKAIPCWSLTSLLSVLPYYPELNRTTSGWRCDVYNEWGFMFQFGERSDNPVDACVAMIIYLHELNLL